MRWLLFILCVLAPFAAAQEQHNFLALDNALLPTEAGPYYFIAQGNNTDAYARADLLAAALGATLEIHPANGELTFGLNGVSATLQTTDNVLLGLQKRVGALRLGDQSRASPLGIVVDGATYVAVGPLVSAFGGESSWDAESRVLFIDSPSVVAPPSSTPSPSTAPLGSLSLGPPRYAFHDTKSRVALDLPAGSSYRVIVEERRFVVAFDGLTAAAFRQAVDDPLLEEVAYEQLGDDLALSVRTRFPLDPEGAGYTLGSLPASAERPGVDVLYIDFAPGLQGEPARALGGTLASSPASTPATSSPSTTPNMTNTTPVAEVQTPHSRKVVVLDAGHGGKFPGAVGHVVEKEVVLAITLKLKALLEAQGVEVVLTREDDVHLAEDLRADLAERARLATPEINLFVSIHANSVENSSAHGIETWVFGQPLEDANMALAIKENGGGVLGEANTQEAIRAASSVTGNLMQAAQLNYSLTLAEMVQREMVEATGARDRGVEQNAFFVIRNARSPAILVEVGFVSNPDEGAKLATDAYRELLARALAKGIMDFFGQGSSLADR